MLPGHESCVNESVDKAVRHPLEPVGGVPGSDFSVDDVDFGRVVVHDLEVPDVHQHLVAAKYRTYQALLAILQQCPRLVTLIVVCENKLSLAAALNNPDLRFA